MVGVVLGELAQQSLRFPLATTSPQSSPAAGKGNMSIGNNEQMFGKKEQVPPRGKATKNWSRLGEEAMNNLEYVRKWMRIKPTPNNAGTKVMIEFTYHDDGLCHRDPSLYG